MSESEKQKQHRIGFLASVGIHGAMILLFIFVMGWKAPNPPLSEMGSGIELNFGLDDQGGGDVQPDVPPGNAEETSAEPQAQALVQDQTISEETAKPEASKTDAVTNEKTLTGDEESVTVNEPKKVVKPKEKPLKVVKPTEKKIVEKPVKKTLEPAKDDKLTDVNELKSTSEAKKGTPGTNQGDDPGKQGDKGNPQGKLNAQALYGNPGTGGPGTGGGGGDGISVTGFEGFERPNIVKPEIPNESYGTYKFAVKVNRDGEVISIKPITKGISLEAERIFKKTIEKTEFVAKDVKLPEESEGVITFKVIPPPAKK